ncbi:MAG: chorismate synthase [Candidatus Omnitrophica bacterium]|nr:chorismate synthase [Candidatus Omnitrophota bacterium]
MLRYMTAGESHGKGMMAIIDGVPAGLGVDIKFINDELLLRMHGYGRGGRMTIEKDEVDIIAGCRKGRTIGSPIGMLVGNKDYKIDELPDVTCPRPGHADLAGIQKYGFRDARDVLERASARETVVRVAVGAVAKLILKEFGIRILSHVTMIGGVSARVTGLSFDDILKLADPEKSKVRCVDRKAEKLMCEKIDKAREDGDTLGGSFEVIADAVPPGLGAYAQWDRRLDGALARAVMAIPAVKAVSIGSGIKSSGNAGSMVHDPITYDKEERSFVRGTNNAGGLEGGLTNGSQVVISGFMKPIATLKAPLRSVDISTKQESFAATERSDVSAVASCGVVASAVVAIELAAALLEKFGNDSMNEIRENHAAYIEGLKKK